MSVDWVVVLFPNGLFKPWLVVIRCDDLELKGLDRGVGELASLAREGWFEQ